MQTLWLEADVRGIYPTYLIVEEVSKTIEIINSSMYLFTSLEFIISIVFHGFMGYTSRKRTKETDSTIK